MRSQPARRPAVVEHNALSLAEAANLLKVPGKVNKDRGAWDVKADALRMTATKAVAAAKAHDKDGILNVGEEIDNACESCHKVYWYSDDAAPKTAQ